MPPQTIDNRVEKLEQRVTVLEELPARLDALTSQALQLREEMHGEFSAIAQRMLALHENSITLACSLHEDAINRARSLHGDALASLADVQSTLRSEIADARNQARILHEDVIGRLALIHEGINASGRRRRSTKKR